MKYSFVAAALVGSVFAVGHKAHAGFHERRHYGAAPPAPQGETCEVTTHTVYVTAGPPPVHASTPAGETATSMEGPKPTPEHSQPGYPGVPQPSKPAVPEHSQPGYPGVPQPSKPAVPEHSQPGYPGVPQPSKPAVPEESKPSHPDTPKETPGKPEHPAVPESTTCTDEVPKPTGPAPVPEESHPAYPGVPQPTPGKPETPEQSHPAYPGVPQSTPGMPETPKETHPGYPGVPQPSKPAVPEQSQPGYPGVPQPSKPAVPQESKPSVPEVPESTTCTDEVPQPTGPAPVPEESKPTHPETPQQTHPAYPGVPQIPEESKPAVPESTTCTDEVPKPTGPAPVPEESHPAYPGVPQTPEQSKPSHPETPKETHPAYPGVPQTPEESKPSVPEVTKPSVPDTPKESHPAVPESTTCTDEEGKPTAPAYPGVPQTPEESKPSVPETPKETHPAYPGVPQTPEESKPSVPEVTKPSTPETPKESKPAVPEESKPSVPEVTKPSYPETPKETKPAQPSVPASSKEIEKPKPTPSQSQGSDKPKATGSYSQGDHIVTNGDKWAITYTPYANSGDCKTADEISADIKVISELGFTTIRSYSTDCGVFEHVVPECEKYGLKVIYGIFLEAGGKEGKGCFSDYAENQLKEIKESAPKDSVAMVIVGNECMFNGNCKAEELASYIDHVREELVGAGFPSDTAITTTEPVGTWEQMGAALCDHIDVFACQVQPYFTDSITADQAGEFAAQQLEQAAKVCPGAADKGKYITEIGWPSAGRNNGKAVAGKAEQKVAMKSILEKVGSESCVFSFQNDGWKAEGEYGVEQNFGCSDVLGLDLGINIDLNISL